MRKKKFVSKAISFILTLCICASGVTTASPGLYVSAAEAKDASAAVKQGELENPAVSDEKEITGENESVLQQGTEEMSTAQDLMNTDTENTVPAETEQQDEQVQVFLASETDAVLAQITAQIDADIPAGSSKNTYSQNYQSMEEEPFIYSYGTGTATVNNGLTMNITGLTESLFIGRWEKAPYLSGGVLDVTFRINAPSERIGFIFKSTDDYKGISFRYDVTDTSDPNKGSWVLQNEEEGQYDVVTGPSIKSDTEYRLRLAYYGKHVVAALNDELILDKNECNSMTDTAVETLGQTGILKRYSADAKMMVSKLNIQGIGTAVKPVIKYEQNYENAYVPNWAGGNISGITVQEADNGNHVLKIPAAAGRVYDLDSPLIKEGTLSLRYKAVSKNGGTPQQFGFRFGITDNNEAFREINWDGGRWVAENQSEWPGIDMQKPISGTWNDLCINFVEGSATVYLNKEEVGTFNLSVFKNAKKGRFGIRNWGGMTDVLIDDIIYTSDIIAPNPVVKYVNNFSDSLTGIWDKGTASIVSEGTNKILRLDGLNGNMALLKDEYAVNLAQGTYLLKVKADDANLGFQFGDAVIKYADNAWTAVYNGETKPFTAVVKDANIMAPKLRSWNNIGITVMENKVTLSINGNDATADFAANLSMPGTFGISSKSTVFVDDITYTEQFLEFSTAPANKQYYEEYYDTIASTDWVDLTQPAVKDGYLNGTIAAGIGAINKETSVTDHGVYQAKLQSDRLGTGLQIGNLAVYNINSDTWVMKDLQQSGATETEIAKADPVAVNADYVIRAELIEGNLVLFINGKKIGSTNVKGIFDKSAGGFGIYNASGQESAVKVDAIGMEEVQVYDENFDSGYQKDWVSDVTWGDNNDVLWNQADGNLKIKSGGKAIFVDLKSRKMKNVRASFDFMANVDSSASGGRYGFVFRESNTFGKGFAVEMDIDGNWGVNVKDSSYPFDVKAKIEANTKYHIQIGVNGKTVALSITDPQGKTTDLGSVTVNALPDVEGYFGIKTWYSGKEITLDNLKIIEEPTIPSLKLAQSVGEIKKGDLTVKMDQKFPRIISYQIKNHTLRGEENEVDTVIVNGKQYTPSVKAVKTNDSQMEYVMTLSDLKVTVTADFTVEDNNVVDFKIKEIKEDGDFKVKSFAFGNNRWAAIDNKMTDSTFAWTSSSGQWHGVSEELLDDWTNVKKSDSVGTTMSMLSANGLAVSIENNVMSGGNKVILDKKAEMLIKKASIMNGTWTYRHAQSNETEELPWAKIVVTQDQNEDNKVDWQDGAVAHRKYILKPVYGAEDMANNMMYISFNFASQANDPFLNTLETGKVLYNYMDGFGQMILHKGYQAEGHDDDIPSYSNIGVRQGGVDDMKYLLAEGNKYNLHVGVHLNATEYHLDANELYYDNLNNATEAGYKQDKLSGGWDWIDTSYTVDQTKDVLTGQLEKRLTDLYNNTKTENGALDFYYIDVYTGNDYNAYKLAEYVNNLGVKIGTEFSGPIEPGVVFTHWGTDLGYPNKGNKSVLSRMVKNNLDIFVGNALFKGQKIPVVDTWGDSKTDIQQGVEVFYNEVLPTKFMQHYGVLKTQTDKITFEGNVTSERNKETKMIELRQDGQLISTWKDTGTTTDESERHAGEALSLIPWNWDVSTGEAAGADNGAKLYHWNPKGGNSAWTLTNAFKNVAAFDLYETTQQGKVLVTTIPNNNGTITIDAKKNTSYVLYPFSSAKRVEAAGNWGEGSPVKDFAFNAEKFSADNGNDGLWAKEGDAAIEVVPGRSEYSIEKEMNENRLNRYAQFKTEGGTLTQGITALEPGSDYTISVWTKAENGRTAKLEVTIGGKTYSNEVTGKDAIHQTSFKYVGTRWQRMNVEFKVPDGVTAGTIRLTAGKGNGTVSYDDVKVWKHTTNETDVNNSDYVLYEDFENTYEGWGPFEYGGGSRQISIATDKSNALDSNDITTAGSKKVGPVMTWVLNGENALKLNEKTAGRYIVTNESSLKLLPNTTYDLKFAYTLEDGAEYVVFVKPVSQGDDDSAKLAFTNLQNEKVVKLETTPNTGDKKTKKEFNGTFTTGSANDYQIYLYELKVNKDKYDVEHTPSSKFALILDDFGVTYNIEAEMTQLKELNQSHKDLNRNDYTEKSYTAFSEAAVKAEQVLSMEGASAMEYRNARIALQAGIDGLVSASDAAKNLAKVLAEARAYAKENYSVCSYRKLEAAVKAAENVDKGSEEAVAAVIKAIMDAKKGLVDVTDARKAVEAAKKVTNDGYTNATWTSFQNAIATVENLIQNDDALTPDRLRAETDKIAAAQNALIKNATAGMIGQLNDFYNKYNGRDGDYTTSSFASMKMVLAEIEALLKDTSNISEEAASAVIEKALQAERALELIPILKSVKMSESKKNLGVKEKYKLKLKMSPTNADPGKLSWKSSKKSVATVDSKGKVTAKKTGTATITVTTEAGKKATCKITVKKAPSKVTLSAKSKTVKVKKTVSLKTSLPKGTAGTVTYSSSNKKIATVDAKGKVKGIKKGKVTITAKTYNGKKAKIKLTVK